MRRILALKRDISSLRRVAAPQRDLLGRLARREFPTIDVEMAYRFRDVFDHVVRLTDESLLFQDRVSGRARGSPHHRAEPLERSDEGADGDFHHLHAPDGADRHVRDEPCPAASAGRRRLPSSGGWPASCSRSRASCSGSSGVAAGCSVGRIHVLPPDLANQIAAGEVIERPASVVKELVENAIDAGATRIAITAEFGGKKLIRVEDDGIGMEPEDARTAIERHATSKIRRADDLAAIDTMGFRGEALPSIASVSHFVLRSRARGRPSGTEIRVNAGAVAAVLEAGMPEGTSVEVADLFYNLPARRKFLKSDAAESAQISRVVTQLALAHPSIGFTLVSGVRPVLRCPPVAGLQDRLYQLYGDRPDLTEVEPPRRRHWRARLCRGPGAAGRHARTTEHFRQSSHRPGSHDCARHRRRVQRGVDSRTKPRSPSLHRDASRVGGRQRASHQGRGALP